MKLYCRRRHWQLTLAPRTRNQGFVPSVPRLFPVTGKFLNLYNTARWDSAICFNLGKHIWLLNQRGIFLFLLILLYRFFTTSYKLDPSVKLLISENVIHLLSLFSNENSFKFHKTFPVDTVTFNNNIVSRNADFNFLPDCTP